MFKASNPPKVSWAKRPKATGLSHAACVTLGSNLNLREIPEMESADFSLQELLNADFHGHRGAPVMVAIFLLRPPKKR